MQDIKLTTKQIDDCFEDATEQQEPLLRLYKLVFPNWDNIDKLDGWPTCNEHTWKYIMIQFQKFDRENHPEVMAGGIWMNNGFSTLEGKDLPNWTFRQCNFSEKKA